MTIQPALGIMNPFMMIIVAVLIAAEKLLPRPEITARLIGTAAILAGTITMIYPDLLLSF
jgi:predicted metal-binding membrane protein